MLNHLWCPKDHRGQGTGDDDDDIKIVGQAVKYGEAETHLYEFRDKGFSTHGSVDLIQNVTQTSALSATKFHCWL